jgi:ATP/maltotriose-dependent transcriptional regulator MalT
MEEMDIVSQHPTVTPPYRATQAAAHVLVSLRLNDLKTASLWGQKLSEYGDNRQIEFQYVLPQLLIAQGHKEEAARMLEDLYQKMVKYEAHGLVIGIRVLQALAAEDEEKALGFLSEALAQGEARGYVRTFVDLGQLITPLLHKAKSRKIYPEYAGRLLAIIEAEERRRQANKVETSVSDLPLGLLSQREIEVLRLLSEGLSSPQMPKTHNQ